MGDMHDHDMPPEDDAEACERMDERPWIRRWTYDTPSFDRQGGFAERLASQQKDAVEAFQAAFNKRRRR